MKQLPTNLTKNGETPVFTEETLPEPLRNWHQTGTGVWAEILVTTGFVQYEILSDPPEMVELSPESPGVIEPEQPHRVKLSEGGEMQVVFYTIDSAS
jgi:tellurite resistance-related uncharacterized protein